MHFNNICMHNDTCLPFIYSFSTSLLYRQRSEQSSSSSSSSPSTIHSIHVTIYHYIIFIKLWTTIFYKHVTSRSKTEPAVIFKNVDTDKNNKQTNNKTKYSVTCLCISLCLVQFLEITEWDLYFECEKISRQRNTRKGTKQSDPAKFLISSNQSLKKSTSFV